MTRMLVISVALLGLLIGTACTTTSEEPAPEPVAQTPTPQPAPPPSRPEPAPVAVSTSRPAPRELPKTASALPLLGLTGVGAFALGGAVRAARTLRRR